MNLSDYEIFHIPRYHQKRIVNNISYYLHDSPYLDIILTDKCNSRCKFCVANLMHNRIDCNPLIFKQKIKYAVDNLNVHEVLLLGGEPTISKDLFDIANYCSSLGLRKVCITTNGIRLNNLKFTKELCRSGITHINISYMSTSPEKRMEISQTNKTLLKLKEVYNIARENNVLVRINNNVFKDNNDSILEMLSFYEKISPLCNSIKFSPLIKTDNFSTINEVTKFNLENTLSEERYESLWKGFENIFNNTHNIIRNPETLGFVEYSIIPLPVPIIMNYNHRGQMMKKVLNEKKINSIKLLPTGDLSLSWNRELPEFFIKC